MPLVTRASNSKVYIRRTYAKIEFAHPNLVVMRKIWSVPN